MIRKCPHAPESQDQLGQCFACMREAYGAPNQQAMGYAGIIGRQAVEPAEKAISDIGSARADRIAFLERKRVGTKADLLLKFEDGDWHGVCDAGMDLRDVDSELIGLRFGGK